MNVLKSLSSVFFEEGLLNFVRRKRNKSFLDNRTMFILNYNNKKVKIFLNKKFGFVDHYIFTKGIYEKEIIDDMKTLLSEEKTMLDIGGNIGQHSLLLAPYCKTIFAFEPIPFVFKEFNNSIKANGYTNIILQNTAIGDKKEVVPIHYSATNAGASSFIKNIKSTSEINVKIDLLENVLPQNQTFDVVKIDVEGYEAVVILGNKEIFLRNRPVFFLEFSPGGITEQGSYSPAELISFFFDNNFEIFCRNSGKTFFENNPEIYQTDNLIVKPRII